MSNSNPKLHHLTSQNYLSHFSPDKDRKRLYRYDKSNKKMEYLPIAAMGAENDYYTVTVNGVKDTSIESPFLSQIDGDYTILVQKFQTREPIENFVGDLIVFVSTQYARVRAQRNRFSASLENLNRQRMNLGVPNDNLWQTDNNHLNQMMLLETDVLSRMLLNNVYFWVGTSDGDTFITCDNPADKCFLPLTSTMCLMMPLKKPMQEYTPVKNDLVEKLNRMTFDKAHRWVYGKSEDAITRLLA